MHVDMTLCRLHPMHCPQTPRTVPIHTGASSSPLRPTKERSQTISYGAHVRESAGLHRIRDSLASSVTGGSLLDDEDVSECIDH